MINKMKDSYKLLKIGRLIGDYLTGKESSTELKHLKEWIDEDENNKSLFNSIKDEKQLSNSIREFDKTDKDAAWKKFTESISRKSKKEVYLRWSVAASILVLLAFSSVTIINYFNSREPMVAEIMQPIAPGEPKAFIELDNGTKFDLQNLNGKQQVKLEKHVGIVVEGNTVKHNNENKAEIKPELLTIVTPRGGEYKMILNDGTQVWLNADSRMEFPNKFNKKERKVRLTGEAYFSVSTDTARPFIVSLNGMDIEVLGTEFNVSAYGNDNFIQTTLLEGKVSIQNTMDDFNNISILSPGQQANLYKENKSVEIKEVDVNQYISWKDGRFVFDHQSLDEIAKVLERWYDVDFVFTDSALKETRFSGEFLRYDNIENVYEIIRMTGTKVDFKQEGRIIEISE